MNLKIRVDTSEMLGEIRCVKADARITKGELIESCPIILIPKTDWDNVKKTVLNNYQFTWDDDHDCIVLGYGSIINHSYEPNAMYTRNYGEELMEFYTLRDIPAGQEITVNYNGDPRSKEPVDESYLDYKL